MTLVLVLVALYVATASAIAHAFWMPNHHRSPRVFLYGLVCLAWLPISLAVLAAIGVDALRSRRARARGRVVIEPGQSSAELDRSRGGES